MSDRQRRWGTGRIVMGVLVVAIIGFIGVVFVMDALDEARQGRERATYAGTWVCEGSISDDYIVLNADGTYRVHVSVYSGSVQNEKYKWSVRDDSIFIPTEMELTVGGPSSGDEKVRGCYLQVQGDRLVAREGILTGTYQRQ
jgi:hypothetical protein